MKCLELQPSSPTRIDCVDDVPRGVPTARSMAYSVMESCGVQESAHIDEMQQVLDSHDDVVMALAKAMQLCTIDRPDARGFIIMHGYDMQFPSLFVAETGGCVRECGIGSVLEADDACVVVVKFRAADSCLITPLVKKRTRFRQLVLREWRRSQPRAVHNPPRPRRVAQQTTRHSMQ
eukprot:3731822-Prymnesium_polylepis.1